MIKLVNFFQSRLKKTPRILSRLLQTIIVASLVVILTNLATPANPNNIVINGDFEAGNTGFTSEYTNDNTLSANQTFAIGTNPNALLDTLASFGDHTSGNGNMLIVRSSRAIEDIWQQTVEVKPHTEYKLSGAYARATIEHERAIPKAAFYINDAIIENLKFESEPGVWSEFADTWNSNTATSATVVIKNSSSFDTFFMFDNIVLESLTP